MKFLIIIPAHNEARNILFTLQSLQVQTHPDFFCVVVNDGSTDETAAMAEKFIARDQGQGNRFKLTHTGAEGHQPGAKVVRTFNAGLAGCDLTAFDIVCKFDADIIFPPQYLQIIAGIYQKNPKAGMVSGLVRIKKSVFEVAKAFDFREENRHWKFEDISSREHVRGPIKSYRKECFLQMGGLRSVLGWDNIDTLLARKNGWQIITVKNLWVKHLRPTAYQYKNQKAEKLGEYFYNIGLSFPLMLASAAKAAAKDNSLKAFITIARTFMKQNHRQALTGEEIKYIRNLRWKQLLRIS